MLAVIPSSDFVDQGGAGNHLSKYYSRLPVIVDTYYYDLSMFTTQPWEEIDPCFGDPVHMVSGSFLWDYTDISAYGANPLNFKRTYSSRDDYDGPLGYGWRHAYSCSLDVSKLYVGLTLPNGYKINFKLTSDYVYISPEGSLYQLEETDEEFIVTDIQKTVYIFDKSGALQSVSDVVGNTITYSYDVNGRLESVSNDSGTLTFTYTNGRLTEIADTTSRFVNYEYDSSGNLVRFTNADGDSMVYTYDANHNIIEVSDFRGKMYLRNVYDENGRVLEQTVTGQGTSYFEYYPTERYSIFIDPLGNKFRFEYDSGGKITKIIHFTGNEVHGYANGRLTSSTDRLGNTTAYSYDLQGNLTGTFYPDGSSELVEYKDLNFPSLPTKITARDEGVALYEYDVRGNLGTVTNANNNTTRFTYDVNNNLTSVIDAMNNVTLYENDAKGNRTKMICAYGTPLETETNFVYDTQGRLKQQITDDGGVTEYFYSSAGKLIKTIDALRNEMLYDVNGNGYDEGNTDALGNETITQYNEMNKPVLVTDAEGNSTAYAYDSVGNLTCTTNALGHSTFYTYDAKGRMVAMTEPASSVKGSIGLYRSWFYQYDAEGRMLSTTDPLGYTTSQEYDNMGRTNSSTNARGKTTLYEYDNMGRTAKVTNALGGKTKSEYDVVGNLIKQTDARGNSWEYEYDALNRIKKAIDPMGTITEYVFDGLGRTTDVIRKIVSTELYRTKSVYDSMGRLIESIDAEGHGTVYEYDLLGRLVKTTDAENGVTEYDYDALGRLVSVTAPDGGKTSYVYDKNGRTTKVTELIDWDSDGNEINKVTEYVYDKLGRAQVVKNVLDEETTIVTRNAYDAAGNLVAVTVEDAMTDINGNIVDVTTGYAYDLLGRVTAITDPNLNVTRSEYDGNGNVVRAIAPDGSEINYHYDDLDRLISYLDAEGYTFSFEYDENGNTTETTDGRGNSMSTDYDALNRPVKYTDELGNESTVAYDADGRVTRRIGFDGAVTKYTYDNNGNVSSVTAVLNETTGFSTEFTYDKLNRVKTTKDARGAVTEYAYNAMGKVTSIKNALNGVKRYEYDLLGRLTKEYNELNQLTEYTYDALGRVLTVKNPLGKFDRFTYDKLGRIETVTDKNGNVTTYTYDANGNIVETRDALGHPSHFAYDVMNRLIQVTLYRMDTNVNEQQVTLYDYDKRGLVTKEINAALDETVYVYDGNGNLVSKTDADDYVTEFGYDARNLLESINYSDEKSVSFLYDAAGRLVEMEDWNGTTTFALDLLGRITSVTDHNSKTTGYTWDAAGNKTGMAYPDGTTVGYTYDLLGRMTNVEDAENQNTVYEYDAASRLISTAYPNSWMEERVYDAAGQLLEKTDMDPTNSENKSMKLSYTYDAQGNILTETKYGNSTKGNGEHYWYGYDELNRLVSMDGDPGEAHTEYSYDSLGNLTLEEYNNNKYVDYSYNLLNQLVTKTVATDGTYGYSYDSRGNLTQIQKGSSVTESYVYDATNRMVLGTNVDDETSAYVYNGLGYLVGNEWTVKPSSYGYNTVTPDELLEDWTGTLVIDALNVDDVSLYKWQVYTGGTVSANSGSSASGNGNQPSTIRKNYVLDYTSPLKDVIMEQESGGASLGFRYVYGLEKLSVSISGITNGAGNLLQDGRVKLWYHHDRLGSSYMLTDNRNNNKAVSVSYVDYDEWGVMRKKVVLGMGQRSLADLVTEYTGHPWDSVISLYFAEARMYDAGNRRFVSVDPVRGTIIEPTTLIQYVYCLNNSVRYTDPWGLATEYERTQAVFDLLNKYNFEETSTTPGKNGTSSVTWSGYIGTYNVVFTINLVNSLIDSGTAKASGSKHSVYSFTLTFWGGNPGADYFEDLACRLRKWDEICTKVTPDPEIKDLSDAYKKMSEYLANTLADGQVVDAAVKYVAKNGRQKTILSFTDGKVQGDKSKWDNDFLGWTNYWFNNSPQTWNFIDAEIAKAITAHEANWGTLSSKNGQRDVMQTLYPGDPTLWMVAHVDPTVKGKTHYGKTEQVVSVRRGNETVDATVSQSYDADEAKRAGFGTNGLDLVKSVIGLTGGGASGNEYLIYYDRVTPRMSIAVGTGLLYYKNQAGTSIRTLIENYNGSTSKANYYQNLVKPFLDDMGFTKQTLSR